MNLLETLKGELENTLTSQDIELYSADLNGETLEDVRVSLDRDGDLCVSVHISEEDLCHHISPDVMEKHLKDEGHL